jgi:hypothetical protein
MSKFSINVNNSTIGAQAVGDHSSATGNVSLATDSVPSQADHVYTIKAAQKALVDDEEALGPVLHEVLGQFLRIAREMQIEQETLVKGQAKMLETLDELWAQKAASELGPVPQGLKTLAELGKNPLMIEVVKSLVGG